MITALSSTLVEHRQLTIIIRRLLGWLGIVDNLYRLRLLFVGQDDKIHYKTILN